MKIKKEHKIIFYFSLYVLFHSPLHASMSELREQEEKMPLITRLSQLFEEKRVLKKHLSGVCTQIEDIETALNLPHSSNVEDTEVLAYLDDPLLEKILERQTLLSQIQRHVYESEKRQLNLKNQATEIQHTILHRELELNKKVHLIDIEITKERNDEFLRLLDRYTDYQKQQTLLEERKKQIYLEALAIQEQENNNCNIM
jgi:hypothetical protein